VCAAGSAVDGYLRARAQRPAGALVAELPRLPGTRETRWAHLLSGPVSASAIAPSDRPAASAKLEERVEALERDVAALQSAIEALLSQRGDSS
jgi:hypothetical protein